MCISCPLHCFIGCGSFGFKFQIQSSKAFEFAIFFPFSPPSPSPLGRPIFPSPFSPSHFLLHCAAQSFARPILLSLFPPARSLSAVAPAHFLHAARFTASSPVLSLVRGPRLSGLSSSPPPTRPGLEPESGSPPRRLAALRLGPARQCAPRPPYKYRRTIGVFPSIRSRLAPPKP
jgi:hypothetical protein